MKYIKIITIISIAFLSSCSFSSSGEKAERFVYKKYLILLPGIHNSQSVEYDAISSEAPVHEINVISFYIGNHNLENEMKKDELIYITDLESERTEPNDQRNSEFKNKIKKSVEQKIRELKENDSNCVIILCDSESDDDIAREIVEENVKNFTLGFVSLKTKNQPSTVPHGKRIAELIIDEALKYFTDDLKIYKVIKVAEKVLKKALTIPRKVCQTEHFKKSAAYNQKLGLDMPTSFEDLNKIIVKGYLDGLINLNFKLKQERDLFYRYARYYGIIKDKWVEEFGGCCENENKGSSAHEKEELIKRYQPAPSQLKNADETTQRLMGYIQKKEVLGLLNKPKYRKNNPVGISCDHFPKIFKEEYKKDFQRSDQQLPHILKLVDGVTVYRPNPMKQALFVCLQKDFSLAENRSQSSTQDSLKNTGQSSRNFLSGKQRGFYTEVYRKLLRTDPVPTSMWGTVLFPGWQAGPNAKDSLKDQ